MTGVSTETKMTAGKDAYAKQGWQAVWRKGTDSLWKHTVKSSTCHIGHEQLAKPAMLPSSSGEATMCSAQLLKRGQDAG